MERAACGEWLYCYQTHQRAYTKSHQTDQRTPGQAIQEPGIWMELTKMRWIVSCFLKCVSSIDRQDLIRTDYVYSYKPGDLFPDIQERAQIHCCKGNCILISKYYYWCILWLYT